MDQWQYGIASTDFRWNLSGSYQQVIPRYFSVDENGVEREFLYDALGKDSFLAIFLKGYQWPFDTRKLEGSSRVDLLVAEQIKLGRKVYLDFTRDPKGLVLSELEREAYDYLERSGSLQSTPIERLKAMNQKAIDLYASHGIDICKDPLRIAVCAQHCNGGVAVDKNWQSEIDGLYVVGEAAGTFGVYRPGGSALNSTQVGSLRAAEHIAARERGRVFIPNYSLPNIKYGESNIASLRDELQNEMSRVADFDRSTSGIEALLCRTSKLRESFFDIATISDTSETADLFKLYDTVLTQCATLDAMLCSAKAIGTHGSAIVDKNSDQVYTAQRDTITLTKKSGSTLEPVSQIPSPELWFEALLSKKSDKKGI